MVKRLFAVLLLSGFALGQATLAPVIRQQFFDKNGKPLAGGLIYTFAAGTTTPSATYTDATGNTPTSNPIVLDSGGWASIWLGSRSYKIEVADKTGVVLYTVDNISPGTPGTFNTGSLNVVMKYAGASVAGPSSMTDDGINPVVTQSGFDVGTSGGYNYDVPNNGSTGTIVNTAACDDGTGAVKTCPSASSTTNIPVGFVASGAGLSGNATLCIIGHCRVLFDNSATALHIAIASSTNSGYLHDTGGTALVAGQPNYLVFTSNTGAGTPAYIRLIPNDFISSTAGATRTVASGTVALGTSAIASGACASVVTATATGALTTDVPRASFNGDPTGVTGYAPVTTGTLKVYVYPTANTVNIKVCNPTASSITPGAITLNWNVQR